VPTFTSTPSFFPPTLILRNVSSATKTRQQHSRQIVGVFFESIGGVQIEEKECFWPAKSRALGLPSYSRQFVGNFRVRSVIIFAQTVLILIC
jgi:hypothetical protein